MKKLIGYAWRLTISLLLVVTWLGLASKPAYAVHQMTVTVTITDVNNLLRGCFDIEPWGCSRPDYFAVVTINGPVGAGRCDTRDQYVLNRDNIEPNWVCDQTIEQSRPLRSWDNLATVTIEIYDFDGGLAGVFNQGNQQADVQPGQGMAFTLPITPGLMNFDTTANGDNEADTRVRGTIEATIQPIRLTDMNVNPIFFDPRFDETVRVTGLASETVSMRDISLTMSVNGPGGVFTTSMFTLGADNQHFTFNWDGRISGVIAPPGFYTITINGQAVPPGVAVINRPQNDLVFLDFDPVRDWYPGLGPLQVRYSTGSDAWVTKRFFEGNNCIGALRRIFVPNSLTSGVSTLGWDGKDETGRTVLPGEYSVEVSAEFLTGTLASFCQNFNVIQAPPLELAVEHAPIVPLVNDAMTFTATALNAAHANRVTGTIEVWVADQNALSSMIPPRSPARICQRAAMCQVDLANLTPGPGRIAYRAVAFDINGARLETPWRIVEVVGEGVIGSGHAIAAGVAADSFGVIRQEKALDIVFFPGNNFDLSQREGGRREFLDDVAASIREFWGIGGVRRPSTLLTNQVHMSYWVVMQNVRIQPLNPADENSRCVYLFFDNPLTWSNANAVLHRVFCRNYTNSPFGNAYSANTPGVSWHELHHRVFGLADEYCCDGGYFQLPVHPNLFFWPEDCNHDPNAPPGGCQPVRTAGNILPGQQTRWWRIDLDPDVMLDHAGLQQGAEVRRTNSVFDQCRLGRC